MAAKGKARTAGETSEPAVRGETLDEEVLDGEGGEAETIRQVRKTLMKALPKSATQLAEKASEGSVPHLKLLLELVGLDDGGMVLREAAPKEKTLEEILMERWAMEP